MVLATQIPGVPEDLKSWPVPAIMGLVTMAGLALTLFTVKGFISTVKGSADRREKEALLAGRAIQAQIETNARLDEICQKLGETNKTGNEQAKALTTLGTEIKGRPCVMGLTVLQAATLQPKEEGA